MLDQLLELFERDRRSTTSKGGLRGKLGALLGSDADDSEDTQRTGDRRRIDRAWDDDRDEDDDRARSSKRRESELFDFGD